MEHEEMSKYALLIYDCQTYPLLSSFLPGPNVRKLALHQELFSFILCFTARKRLLTASMNLLPSSGASQRETCDARFQASADHTSLNKTGLVKNLNFNSAKNFSWLVVHLTYSVL
jgi:hypothetical protein